jgi:hypothetical protein
MSHELRYHYDIHDIITIASEAQLPELAAFRVERSIPAPTMTVRIGKVDAPQGTRTRKGTDGYRETTYVESAGAHGFAVKMKLGETTEILASPLLRRSPHVLYTNVIEPVLRWTFVERGYALVHGACIAVNGEAFLITARTDTGKTTTILKTLDAQSEYEFLSDDLTLVSPNGGVLPYPKPLTISRHTVSAVNTPLLTATERATLVIQSRLHSKSGRWFGLFLTRTGLPMATTNAIVQWIVPPPKYPVQRLVPHARVASSALLTGLVIIERGEGDEVRIDHDEAIETLLENCDDAYGFPPYADIKQSLYFSNGRDLREREREIVAMAFDSCPAVLMRSQTRDWWQMLPAFVTGVLRARAFQASPVTGDAWVTVAAGTTGSD